MNSLLSIKWNVTSDKVKSFVVRGMTVYSFLHKNNHFKIRTLTKQTIDRSKNVCLVNFESKNTNDHICLFLNIFWNSISWSCWCSSYFMQQWIAIFSTLLIRHGSQTWILWNACCPRQIKNCIKRQNNRYHFNDPQTLFTGLIRLTRRRFFKLKLIWEWDPCL